MGPTNLMIGGTGIARPSSRLSIPTLGEVARYSGGLGVTAMTPAEADVAARRSMGSVYGNMASRGQAILDRYGPGIDALAGGVRAIDSGSDADIAWATMDVALAAVALVPPVGTIVAAVGKILTGLIKWLVETYPAYQVQCTPSAVRRLCETYVARYGRSGTANMFATVLRDERRFWIGSTHTRAGSAGSWSWANNNENICKDYLPGVVGPRAFEGGPITDVRFCTYMDRGTEAERMARLEIACRPVRGYKPGVPAPWGSRSWLEWENENPARQQKRYDDMAAAVVAGQEIRDDLIANGDPRYVGWWGEQCAWYGFWIKLAGLPNESLIETLSKVAQSAPESLPDNVDPNTYIQLAPDTPGVVFWEDGLVGAYLRFFQWVPRLEKTYAVKALIDEYNDRVASGAIVRASRFAPTTTVIRDVSESRKAAMAAAESKPWTTGETVAAVGITGGLVAVATKLAGWW